MKRKTFTAFLFFLVGVVAVCWVVIDMRSQLQQPLELKETSRLHIRPGTNLTSISHELVNNGWLSHPYYLIFEGRRQGVAGSIKAGEYAVTPGTTPLMLLDQIVSGRVIQYSLTIPEGWAFRQIIERVSNSEMLVHTLPGIEPVQVMNAIGYPGQPAEGRFFPDTYNFTAQTTDVQFLRRAFERMDAILAEEWQQRAAGLPYQSPYEALIMASIIEKETSVPYERGTIAGVFVRRLQLGIKLQTDPTVIYAMGERYDGDIRYKDLAIDSPYNTYVYRGLPPTPIASPGRASINAALHPEDGQALYFVSKGDGSHYFSTTLAEHNRAVKKYQSRRR